MKFQVKVPGIIHSIGTKFYLWMILFIILPVCFTFLYSFKVFEGIIKEEVSNKNIENIAGIEGQISNIFDNIVKVSNLLSSDDVIVKSFLNAEMEYYDKFVDVQRVISNILDSNITLSNSKITIFDLERNVYSNWSLNYNDYQFLYEEDWVQQAIKNDGHLVWRLFEPTFIKEEKSRNPKYISLARTIKDLGGKSVGVLIISVNEQEFIEVFQNNKYISSKDDCVLITNNQNKILISLDNSNISTKEEVADILNDVSNQNKGYMLKEIDGIKYMVNYYTIIRAPWTFEDSQWKVTVFTLYDKIIYSLRKFSSQVLLFFIVFIFAVLIISGFLTGKIVNPIKRLDRRMLKFSMENDLSGLDIKRKDEIGHLNQAFYNMAQNIRELFQNLKAEHEVRERYRFESLRAQINPHFLFNTLNMIRWMALIRKADNIVESIDALANLLKFSMSRGSEVVLLKDELENIKSYVFIQNSRYGGKYQINFDFDENIFNLKVIKFILQPSVENAIIHAFKGKDGSGNIFIVGKVEYDKLFIIVKDDGIGMKDEVMEKILYEDSAYRRDEKKVTGIGLKIVNERIKMAYGEKYGIEVSSIEGSGTTIKYLLPIITEEDDKIA